MQPVNADASVLESGVEDFGRGEVLAPETPEMGHHANEFSKPNGWR